MIYSTTKTNSNLRKKVIEARVAGEHIRTWEQHTGWESSPYPLYRIYAETFEDSQATILLNGSKNYKEISEEELDDAVGKTQALELWKSYKLSKNTPDKAALIVMAGYPLSGKTTLSRAIVENCPDNTVHVESDSIRQYVAESKGHKSPRFSYTESLTTFNIAHELIRLALSSNANVILDATNLQEKWRFDAYLAAEEYSSPVAIVLVEAPDDILEKRLEKASEDKVKAYNNMSRVHFTKVTRNYPLIKIDSSNRINEMLVELKGKLPVRLN